MKANASEIVQVVLESPKVAAATAVSTTAAGGASLLLQMRDWISLLSLLTGFMLSLVLLITHTIKLRNEVLRDNMRRRADDVDQGE